MARHGSDLPQRSWLRVVIVGLVYLGLGIISAIISNPLQAGLVQASIRVGVLCAAIAVFYGHARFEFARLPDNLRVSALLAAAAVSCGTCLLAVYAIGSAWLESAHVGNALLAALVIWPVATGIPAFLAALLLGRMRVWARARARAVGKGA